MILIPILLIGIPVLGLAVGLIITIWDEKYYKPKLIAQQKKDRDDALEMERIAAEEGITVLNLECSKGHHESWNLTTVRTSDQGIFTPEIHVDVLSTNHEYWCSGADQNGLSQVKMKFFLTEDNKVKRVNVLIEAQYNFATEPFYEKLYVLGPTGSLPFKRGHHSFELGDIIIGDNPHYHVWVKGMKLEYLDGSSKIYDENQCKKMESKYNFSTGKYKDYLPRYVGQIGDSSISAETNCIETPSKNIVSNGNTTAISDNAYTNNKFESFTVSDGIVSIGKSAFRNCNFLKSISFPDSLNTIGEQAFEDCWQLQSVSFPNNLINIGEHSFAFCIGLQSISFPNSLTSIERNAFVGCVGLQSLILPDSLTEVGDNSFMSCKSLKSIIFPKKLTKINKGCFDSCSSLTSASFGPCLEVIDLGAFYGCSSLTFVTLPRSLKLIENSAFDKCPALNSVYFLGTVDEWNAITIQDDNESLTNANRYYYSDTQPTDKTYNYWHYVDGVETPWTV
jgi:hypothetical protein